MMHETIAVEQPEAPVPPAEPPSLPPSLHGVPLAQVLGHEPGMPLRPLRPLLPLAIIISCALHAAAAAAMLFSVDTLPEFGVLQTKSDAMSLETTQTFVLESTMSEPLDTAAAAAAAMPQGTVETVEAEPLPVKEAEELPIEEPAEAQPIKAAQADPDAIEADEEPLEVIRGSGKPVEAPTKKVDDKKPDKKLEADNEKKEKKRERVKRQRQKRQIAGGATSRAKASEGKTGGRASASRGSVLSYAARVRAKVARNRPSGQGHRGTARISFGVSRSGGLRFVRLARSSGNSALDRAAVSAVRRAAPFGSPPAGASSAQLRFSIPFYFK